MDLDVFVATHQGEWARLDALARTRRLTGEEADELVTLYQRVTGHLAKVQAAAPDPTLEGRLTSLVSRARDAVTGSRSSGWRDVARYYSVSFPAALYRSRRWWLPVAVLSSSAPPSSPGGWRPTPRSGTAWPRRRRSAR